MANETLPKVTGLIVDATTRRPGEDFFPSYDKIPITDDASWQEEARASSVAHFPRAVCPCRKAGPRLVESVISNGNTRHTA